MQIEDVLGVGAALGELLLHRSDEGGFHLFERNAILRAFRPGHRRLDTGEFQLEHISEDRIGRGLGAEHALRLGIGLNQRHLRRGTVGVGEIAQSVVVDRKRRRVIEVPTPAADNLDQAQIFVEQVTDQA